MIRLPVWLKNEDHRLLYLVNLKFKCPLLDWWMPKITHLGGAVCSIGAALLLLCLGDAGQDGLIALAASHLLVQVLKSISAAAGLIWPMTTSISRTIL